MVAKTSPVPRAPRLPSLSKYEVLGELGHGGMATVYRAHDRRLGRDVAVKLLHAHLRDSSEVAARFSTEARAVAKLRHPNIVEVYDVSGDDDDEQFLVVELVRGPSLRRLLADRGALPPEVGVAIVLDVLAALASAHDSGVVHRDVKPENVLIEHRPAPREGAGSERDSGDLSGGRVRVKLTDFGIAKLLDAQGVTSTGQVLGSPAHMAPEQIEGVEVDERADVFGAGVLLYECIVGHLPFEGQNPAQVLRRVLEGIYGAAEQERPVVGAVLSRICDRALAREPEGRYASVRAMHEVLSAELERLGITDPRAEVEAYLDDPEGYEVAHASRMVERLRALGDAARARGDALASAADYNRALAFAPHDAKLLRLVTGLRRSGERRALALRILPMVLVSVCVCGASFGLTRALRARRTEVPVVPTTASVAPSIVAEVPSAPPVREVASVTRPPARPTVVLPKPSAAPKVRQLGFASVVPAQGVLVSIDGTPAGDVSTDRQIPIDDKPHELVFSCRSNLCVPDKRVVSGGDVPVRLEVALRIRDAQVLVEGRPDHSYGIDKRPGTIFRAGSTVNVPMPIGGPGFEDAYVVELESQRKVRVQLKGGSLARAVFPAE
ncbi:MAG: serine/threonine protein kinase [Myxococcales bacterium]|nr:serine/threonine protein kinase [Myxococcales bacterium]